MLSSWNTTHALFGKMTGPLKLRDMPSALPVYGGLWMAESKGSMSTIQAMASPPNSSMLLPFNKLYRDLTAGGCRFRTNQYLPEYRCLEESPLISMIKAFDIATLSREVRRTVAQELWASWPIPLERNAATAIGFFYYPHFGPPGQPTVDLYPPNWWLRLSGSGGEILEISKKTPAYYGLPGPADVAFAHWQKPPRRTAAETNSLKLDLLLSLDRLIVSWLEGTPEPNITQEKRDFCKLFAVLSEAPLRSCYYRLSAFYQWVGVDAAN